MKKVIFLDMDSARGYTNFMNNILAVLLGPQEVLVIVIMTAILVYLVARRKR